MNMIKNLTLATLALGLVYQAPAKQAENSSPLQLTFEKSFLGIGPGVILFAGTFDGELTGTLSTELKFPQANGSDGKVLYLDADYIFFDADENYLFTASVKGRLNASTGKAVLNGEVTDGAMLGAQVQVQFDDLGYGNSSGTIRIMHAH